jgi:hypothetical protein
MIKISPRAIIADHVQSLRNVGCDRLSFEDIFFFYVLPVILAVITWVVGSTFDDAAFSVSISVFAIFSALLLSVQVAIYGVFRSERRSTGDGILDAEQVKRRHATRLLIRELNANVSYLIFLSIISVTVFLALYVVEFPCEVEAAALVGLYSHFLFTVIMVIKRSHSLFDAEYENPSP